MRMLWLASLLATLCMGCQKESDVEKPTVSIDSPSSGGLITTDEGLRLVATLADNTGLLQYKIVISGIDSLNGIAADSTLSLIYIDGIPNKEKTFYLDQVIELSPNTFNGFYQLTLACIDTEGNESFRDTALFEVQNSIDSEPPVFNVSGIDIGDTLRFGEGFSPGGMITDSQSLIYSTFYVGRTNGSFDVVAFEFSNIEDNAVMFGNIGWYFQVDSTWAKGDYHMYYTAWDNYSGVEHTIPFYVTY